MKKRQQVSVMLRRNHLQNLELICWGRWERRRHPASPSGLWFREQADVDTFLQNQGFCGGKKKNRFGREKFKFSVRYWILSVCGGTQEELSSRMLDLNILGKSDISMRQMDVWSVWAKRKDGLRGEWLGTENEYPREEPEKELSGRQEENNSTVGEASRR